METSVTPKCKCLRCDYPFDCASSVSKISPEPGDISICLMCGHEMAFAKDLTVRELTKEERVVIEASPFVAKLKTARKEAIKYH